MPANLNALIRYKTIDRLLGTGRKYTLSELVRHCSEQLGETRGRYKSISKRTIQEDIRVMRSDILGFNAPIKNSFGMYYYGTRYYSIFNTSVSNIDILKRVFDFLLSVRNEMSDDRLDKLLVDLSDHIPERENFDISNEPAKAEVVHEPERIPEVPEEEMGGSQYINCPRREMPKRATKPAPKLAPQRKGDTVRFRRSRVVLFQFAWREISELIRK